MGDSTTRALGRYARYFNSVEGNTTFYGIPDSVSVNRWQTEVPDTFRFCFKLPQTITHQHQLRHCQPLVTEFLDRITPLQPRTGLISIQLPASFSPRQIDTLALFLQQLPDQWHYSVEVRHPDFFNKQHEEQTFNRLLAQYQINRTMFDTRWLFSEPADDLATQDALQKKPRLPLHVLATGQQPMVRFISALHWQSTNQWLTPWLKKVLQWIDEGRTPYLFFHTPDNNEAPLLAQHFCQLLEAERPALKNPLDWPDVMQQQSSLF
ncbi:MAG: DUF72 domain-containing protein [Marinobacterium sp.]|nr:DUF72 domain-containing protein [Marinobacterium sp.]